MKKVFSYLSKVTSVLSTPNYSRTLSLLVVLIILAIIPLTIYIGSKNSDIRQRASDECLPDSNPPCYPTSSPTSVPSASGGSTDPTPTASPSQAPVVPTLQTSNVASRACGDFAADLPNYTWKAFCGQSCIDINSCTNLKNTSDPSNVNPDTSFWCYPFSDGQKCVQLQSHKPKVSISESACKNVAPLTSNPQEMLVWTALCDRTYCTSNASCPPNPEPTPQVAQREDTAWCTDLFNDKISRCLQLRYAERLVGIVVQDGKRISGFNVVNETFDNHWAVWSTNEDGPYFAVSSGYSTDEVKAAGGKKIKITLKDPPSGFTCKWGFTYANNLGKGFFDAQGQGCTAEFTVKWIDGKSPQGFSLSPNWGNHMEFTLYKGSPPAPSTTGAPRPSGPYEIAGLIKDKNGNPASGITVEVYGDGVTRTGKQSITTDTSGKFSVKDFIRLDNGLGTGNGDAYAVRIPLPQGTLTDLAQIKTTTPDHTWQFGGQFAGLDTPLGVASYEFQLAGHNDCAGVGFDGSSGRCNFKLDIISSSVTPTQPPSTCHKEGESCGFGFAGQSLGTCCSNLGLVCHNFTDGGVCEKASISPSISVPQTLKLAFSLGLQGIGSTGDNVTPQNASGSNKNPLHPQRNLSVEIFDGLNNLLSQASSNNALTYNATTGKFFGTIEVPNIQTNTSYSIKVKTDGFLKKRLDGIQTLSEDPTKNQFSATVVTGDINNDNAVNILDYNLLLSCVKDETKDNPAFCPAAQKLATDLNDDGRNDAIDFNLLLRALAVQNGD